MKKKLLLVNPPQEETVNGNLPSFVDEARGNIPPIGLLYTAAAVMKDRPDWEVRLCDMAAGESLDFYSRPDLVGITATTFTLLDVLKVAKTVKQTWGCPVVVGGIHPTIYPKETANLPNIDCAYIGESETTFPQMIDLIASGLAYLCRGGDVDIRKLPMPAYELLDRDKYYSLIGRDKYSSSMFTSRGCPFQCVFCHRLTMGNRFRARTPLQVVEEIEYLKGLGVGEILFYDDTFTVNKRRVLNLCNMMVERKLKIAFDIRARVDTIDLDMLYALKEAGCKRIHYGVEAGNNRILNNLQKGITVEQVENIFWTTKLFKIETLAYFMVGNPGETEEDILNTIQFAKRLDPAYCHFAILTPYPATPLYLQGINKGFHGDYWLDFARDPKPGWQPPYYHEHDAALLDPLLIKAYKDFYIRPKVFARELLKTRTTSQAKRKLAGVMKVIQGGNHGRELVYRG